MPSFAILINAGLTTPGLSPPVGPDGLPVLAHYEASLTTMTQYLVSLGEETHYAVTMLDGQS